MSFHGRYPIVSSQSAKMAAPGDPPHNETGMRLVRDIWGVTSVAIVAKIRIRQFKLDDVCMIAAQVSSFRACCPITVSALADLLLSFHIIPVSRAGRIDRSYDRCKLRTRSTCLGSCGS